MRTVTGSYPVGALGTAPIARGTFRGRRVLVKVLQEAMGVAGHDPPAKVDAARAGFIIDTGNMSKVRELDPELPTWLTRWTTYLVVGSGQVLLVEELRREDEMPEWLSLTPWDEIPEIELPDDLFSRFEAPKAAAGLAD